MRTGRMYIVWAETEVQDSMNKPSHHSLFQMSGLPETFGVVLLTVGLVLLLSPYLGGYEVGDLSIPELDAATARILKIIGPVIFLVLIFAFVPIWKRSEERMQAEETAWLPRSDERFDRAAYRLMLDASQLLETGQADKARSTYERARTLYWQLGDHRWEANALWGLGELELRVGSEEKARSTFEEARRLYQLGDDHGDRVAEVSALMHLGELALRLGRNDQAWVSFKDARSIAKKVERRDGEASALIGLGNVEQRRGRIQDARAAYEEAYSLVAARRLPADTQLAANALMGLGRLEKKSAPDAAKEYFDRAAELYESLGATEQERLARNEAERVNE